MARHREGDGPSPGCLGIAWPCLTCRLHAIPHRGRSGLLSAVGFQTASASLTWPSRCCGAVINLAVYRHHPVVQSSPSLVRPSFRDRPGVPGGVSRDPMPLVPTGIWRLAAVQVGNAVAVLLSVQDHACPCAPGAWSLAVRDGVDGLRVVALRRGQAISGQSVVKCWKARCLPPLTGFGGSASYPRLPGATR